MADNLNKNSEERIMTLREFCRRYRNGDFRSKNRATQIEAGWYDWFCKQESLAKKLTKIWKILKGIDSDYMLDNYCVLFSNHCCANGVLYDSVRFAPLDESRYNELCFLVDINSGRSNYKYETVTARSGYGTEVGFNNVEEVVKFINAWETTSQDKSFYERKATQEKELKELLDKATKLLTKCDEMIDGRIAARAKAGNLTGLSRDAKSIQSGCAEKDYRAREILKRLHEAGGCGAEEESWDDGWDTAIDEAISIVEDVTGISVTEVLD